MSTLSLGDSARRPAQRLVLLAVTAAALVLALFVAKAALEPPVTLAGSGTVTVQLLNSSSAGLAGGNVYYYDSGWQSLGTTNGSGEVSGAVPKTTDIQIKYLSGLYKWQNIDPATNPTLTINTVPVTVSLKTCDGTPLVGEAKYYYGGFTSIGPTPATIELLPYSGLGPGQGNYDFVVEYGGRTTPIHTQDISVDQTVVFKTTKVSLFGSNVLYYNGGWKPLPSPLEMIGGTSNKYGNTSWVDVKFNGSSSPTVRLDVDGCTLSGGMLTLVDNNGDPLANYPSDYPGEQRNLKAKYRCGGSWGPTTSFKTDANGQFFVDIGCGNWDKKVTVTLNQTTREQNVVTGSSVFQAAKVRANLKTCGGPITDAPGGTVAQGGGYWYTHGQTGSSGTVKFYAFPGNNVKVRMSYNHNSETVNAFPVVAGVNNIDYQTTAVTLDYPGAIRSNKGGSWWMFDKPTMDLLPGNYDFWFKNGGSWFGPETLTVSGCAIDKSFVLLKVLDETGDGVAGGQATPAYGGSWGATLPGQTNANGILFAEIPPGYTKISMAVNQGGEEQTLAQLGVSNYTWTTEILRVCLQNHSGNYITDQTGVLDQGGGYWYSWGNLNGNGCKLIPLFARTNPYKFRVSYNYTSDTQYPVVSAGAGIQTFDFQTGQVFGSCITEYSTGAWRTFTDGMELLPGTYTFKSPSQSGTVTAGGTTNLTCP